MEPKLAATLRAKKLGILIRDARLAAGKSMKECGAVIGATGARISAFEKGTKSPSLPELEILSYFLKVPISRFSKDEIKSTDPTMIEHLHKEHTLSLRDRFIGEKLEEIRVKGRWNIKDVREATGITPGKIRKYEAGDSPVPLPELEILSNFYHVKITEFFDLESDIGSWVVAQDNVEEFLSLPLEIQEFVSKPVNRPYLEIAQRLSKLSADELRTIAEGLLEITI